MEETSKDDQKQQQQEEELGGTQQQEQEQEPTMTKKQMKRLKKAQYLAEKKKMKKEMKKQERKAKRAAHIEDVRARKGPITPEELDKVRQAAMDKVNARRARREALRENVKKSLVDGQRIVIDLDFESYMHEGEIKSIIQQIAFSYGMNKNAAHPCHLILSSVSGAIRQAFDRQFKDNGAWYVTQTDTSYLDYFSEEKDKLVYLTAESENEIRELDKDRIYVVGGIVDKNRHKGLCYKRAVEHGIETARLPIGEYIKLRRSNVMCTNHVVEMLVRWQDTKDWQQAFESVVPERKRETASS
jgi:tRNA (guanine9-N1)-methyltransferase